MLYKIFLLCIVVLIGILGFKKVVAPEIIIPEPKPVVVIKSFDSEVHRLAVKYGVSESLSREIIRCEGEAYKTKGNNQNISNTTGQVWSEDVGYWQINNYYHQVPAKALGFDIYDDWDNLEYGFRLLATQGTKPWKASQYCWGHIIGI